MSILLAVQKKKNDYKLIFQFYNLYITRGIGIVIFVFLFALIFIGFLSGLLESLILDKLTPNYIIIGHDMGKIPSDIINIEDYRKWIILVIIILQIFVLLFYLEIFEFNFCSLNKNTKNNIIKRGDNLFDDNEEFDEDIEIVRGYYISHIMDNKEIEMVEKKR